MKLQCACGAKYSFDISPEMVENPVKFICPSCGADSSDFVNELVRQEYGAPPPPPPAAAPGARLRISAEAAPATKAPVAHIVSKFCSKHVREQAIEKCAVCHQPICQKCLNLFGYFCSPLCRAKAEAQGLDVPVYAGRKDLVQAQYWRKTGLIFGSIGAVIAVLLGVWTWYAWFGSVPHTHFSVRFEDTDRAYSGRSQLVGNDQLVFLHGGKLARYDLKTKKSVWTQELVTKPQVADALKAAAEADAAMNSGGGYTHRRSASDIERSVKQMLEAELSLRVSGQNIWVGKGNKLTRYDWDSGQVGQEITLPERGGEPVEKGDELQLIGEQSVTHISLASGATRVEQFGPAGPATLAALQNPLGGGLARTDNDKALDPQQVEAQVQNLKLPARIALPALLANAEHERQLEAALKDDPKQPRAKNAKNANAPVAPVENFQLVAGQDGFVQFSTRLLEERIVTREAMKAPPAKSVLNGDLNVTQTAEVANEMLNEMQRNRGGDTIEEDESRYLATVHLPDSPGTPDWIGEVVGPPQVYVLKTVNVIAAGKSVTVLDKTNKKLWQATLTYAVPEFGGELFGEESQFGAGPCVEQGDTLYVFDQAVLSAFELNSGNARWRLPSVGVAGLFFDDHGSVYVNTTSGNPDDIKYSRQIDISRRTDAVLIKVDPKTGKTLWSVKPGGNISYLSGKFIYSIQSYDPNPTDEEETSDLTAALQKPAYLRIARIRPADGRVMWEHYQSRCPIDARFHDNSIELIFKREVQVLRYLSL